MNDILKILLIEDDTDDIELLEEALKDNHVLHKLNIIMEGDKVATYIQGDHELPHVIVLDFNLPKLHGKQVLNLIKSSERFRDVPVVVLTTSSAKEDADYAYKFGADHFITKPTTPKDFEAAISKITECANRSSWF